ncbi:CD0415/CD1112 family protein [Clostridium sporogenes]|uniref:VirB6/TrbL-like conjugal transfer protein, CD1112 family n=1 Tax=Clostridium sporogenes TaxID=1509 RepID=UPI00313C4BFF
MFGLFDKITEFFQEIFIGIIQANLEAMFLDINENVSLVATEVGKTPSGWNAEVFSFIKNINDTVVIPIAGIIITAVLCIELINMVMEKNNMHSDTDTFDFFKYIIKMWIAVWLVSNAFTFSMAVFDVSQTLVTKAAGVINTSAVLDSMDVAAMVEHLKDESLWNLILIALDTSLVKLSIQVVSIIIIVITYGRMIEICLYSSVSSIPFATMGNKEWGQIGTNYIKGLFALGLQGLFLMICLGIYAVLVKTIHVTTDIHTSIFGVLGYTVLLGIMMLKSGTIAKSIMNAH